jgi:DNA primase
MNNRDKIDRINDTVTMPDILGAYGIGTGRRGRIACPIHGGNNNSSFSYNKTQFQCFNCGAKGGVIQFVEAYMGMDFNGSLDEINRLFRLWDDDREQPESLASKRRRKSRRRSQDRKKLQAEREKEKKEALLLEMHRLIANKTIYAPKNEMEEWHPLYVEALHRLPIIEYRVDCL